ncbi:hypothetical protein AS188_15140 [Kocuria flava]|nr:heparan-alpha-glucosaminide N-acetyltransferase domain-containing protein [Kocuria flava]ALU40857.1 hypothetical protein AS188_15140 [Kocuria flava]
MSDDPGHQKAAHAAVPVEAGRVPRKRLPGIDAARGLALIGLTAIHFLPAENEQTHEATLSWTLFSGDSAALFALLAGVGLAFSTGGRHPRTGRRMTGARVGVAVRALLIFALGVAINSLMPEDPPAFNILTYYGVFFVLTIPFLHLPARTLFLSAAGFAVAAPVLMLELGDQVPEFSSGNPTVIDVLTDPGATLAQLLLTGTYPALPYLTYLLVGLGIGRLHLHHIEIQTRLLAIGAGLAVTAQLASWLVLYIFGGYHQLTHAASLDEETLDGILIWGPDDALPAGSWWWLAITTPHTNMPLAIAWSLGVSLAVLGAFLLLARKVGPWLLPLSAMGAMTLTLYSTQLVLLSFELHYDQPELWFLAYLVAAAVFAMAWQRAAGQGPLERVVAMASRAAGRAVVGASADPGRR